MYETFWTIFDGAEPTMLGRLLGALLMGALIGLERSVHGRPAGFRTHALVCLASAALMLISVYQDLWPTGLLPETVRTDPTRMAQGIMTGVGFIGAGVIFKEGPSIRGLTTAASIWLTATIGILVGIGFYLPAAASCLAGLGVLSAFRRIERLLPRMLSAHHTLRFERQAVMPEETLRAMIEGHGFAIANLGYGLAEGGRFFEYRMTLYTGQRANLARLATSLSEVPGLVEFRISPSGE